MNAREKEEKWINIVAFFVYGFAKFSMEVMVMTTTEDVLSGSSIPSTMLLLATYVPHSLCAAILPYFAGQIGQLAVSVMIFVFLMAGLLLMALPALLEFKFVGAAFIGLGAGISDTLMVGFTARYSDITVHAYVGGTGVSGVLGNLFYTGMTTWLCISPSTMPLTLLVLPPLVLVFHYLMDKRQPEKLVRKAPDQSKIEYSALGSHEADEPATFSCRDKLQVVYNIKLLIASLFIGYLSKYLTLQAVVTTLAFPNAPFDPRDHYPYYILVYLTGDFLGRAYGLFVSLVKCTDVPLVTSHTWIISSIIVAIQMILVFASWYHFLPNVYVALAIVFVFGLVNGALYCSSFIVASRGSSSRHIEYARAFLTISVSTGVIAAGLLGLYTEPTLTEHCLRTFSPVEYCLTRSSHGWNASTSCSVNM